MGGKDEMNRFEQSSKKMNERYKCEKLEDHERWQRFLISGEVISHGDMISWLDELVLRAGRGSMK